MTKRLSVLSLLSIMMFACGASVDGATDSAALSRANLADPSAAGAGAVASDIDTDSDSDSDCDGDTDSDTDSDPDTDDIDTDTDTDSDEACAPGVPEVPPPVVPTAGGPG